MQAPHDHEMVRVVPWVPDGHILEDLTPRIYIYIALKFNTSSSQKKGAPPHPEVKGGFLLSGWGAK